MLFAYFQRLRRKGGPVRRLRATVSSRTIRWLLLYIAAITIIHAAAMVFFEGMAVATLEMQ